MSEAGAGQTPPARAGGMRRFALVFSLALVALLAAELLPWGQQWLVRPLTGVLAELSAGLLGLFDSDVGASGRMLFDRINGFAVIIEPGCNGVEGCIVLVAAMLAFPASWRARLIGIGLGVLGVQAVNLVRIISLFYLGQWNLTVFNWTHLYLWQSLIVLDALLLFILWVRYAGLTDA